MLSKSDIKKFFKAFFAIVILTGLLSGCATKGGQMMLNKTETEQQQDPVRR